MERLTRLLQGRALRASLMLLAFALFAWVPALASADEAVAAQGDTAVLEPPALDPEATAPPAVDPAPAEPDSAAAPAIVDPVTDPAPGSEAPVGTEPTTTPATPAPETTPATPAPETTPSPVTTPAATDPAQPAAPATPAAPTDSSAPATGATPAAPAVSELTPLTGIESTPAPAPAAAPPSDGPKRAEPIVAPRTELISTTTIPAVTPIGTNTREGATSSAAASQRQPGDVISDGSAPAATMATAAPTTTHPTAASSRFALRSGIGVELAGTSTPPPSQRASDLTRRTVPDDRTTGDGVFNARIEAPVVPLAAGGSSLLAVLASYIIPGSGPVPMSLAITLLAQIAVMLLAMRPPRIRMSERVVMLGLMAGMLGHRRAVQRPG